ncbi:AglZ/HisF2 family acetamidino modification protein [Hoeflea olei]|uniref:Imidazole glycerol phosphate synthase subunit HisF n=1 Tax=Hoeflea olei TaxID=1480615 RepID=A0A1C1YUI8_9HYPH|nr:AglZ/HisF2 family acetamidino modification protein [Hoeflea olei]OCW57010.1 imidazole glycerol phosphate synthase cyclase subunit [Hoeflea olei]
MLTTRVIPTLLLRQGGLVKTTKFSKPVYVGDPINAIKIFNTKEVDELILLDITASREGRPPAFETIGNITAECFMPLAYGGGIRTVEDIRSILKAGVEKVVLNHAALATPDLVRRAAEEFGSQAIIVSIDVKKTLFGAPRVYSASGAPVAEKDPVAWARQLEALGAGEIYLTSVDHEGTMAGYDLALVEAVSAAVSLPVIASGGAGRVEDFRAAKEKGASAVAAGAMFVFQGPHKAVLITYPPRDRLEAVLG